MPDESKNFEFPIRLTERRSLPSPDRPVEGSVQLLIPTPEADIWALGANEPFVPLGLASVIEAFNRVGEAQFGAEWTRSEGAYRGNLPPFPRPSVVFDDDSDRIKDLEAYRSGHKPAATMLGIDIDRRTSPLTNPEWCEATERWQLIETYGPALLRRREAVVDIVHRALADRDLLAVICHEDGTPIPVKHTVWNCDRAKVWERLRTGSLSDVAGPAAPFFPAMTFFFDGEATETFVVTLPGRSAKSRPDDARSLFNRSSTWDEISSWYVTRIAEAPDVGYTRDEDERAGKAVGIGRDRIRDLRRQFKPAHWSDGGRPSQRTRRI